jgi:hypothetical protein
MMEDSRKDGKIEITLSLKDHVLKTQLLFKFTKKIRMLRKQVIGRHTSTNCILNIALNSTTCKSGTGTNFTVL